MGLFQRDITYVKLLPWILENSKHSSTDEKEEDDRGNDGDYYYFICRKIKEPSINIKWATTIYWDPLKVAIVYPQTN